MSLTSTETAEPARPAASPLIPRVPFGTVPAAPSKSAGEELEDKLDAADEALIDIPDGTESLVTIDMLAETIQLYRRTKRLLVKAMNRGTGDGAVPMNQQAQIVNSLGSLLKSLGGLQMRMYDSERLKKLEGAIIEVMRTLPEEQQDLFLKLYRERIDV
jgi:hypothetical protein